MVLVFMIASLGVSTSAEAQTRKERDSLRIIERTSFDIDYFDSDGKEVLDKIERYDERGEMIEVIEYETSGRIKTHTQYQYKGKLLTGEKSLDHKGRVISNIEYEYDADGLRISRKIYDAKGRIVKERIYRYKKKDS